MPATGTARLTGIQRLFAFRSKRYWGRVALFLLVCSGLVLASLQGYRAIDEELTGAALSRRIAVAQLAAATISEKFEHLVDVGVALATRVRFRQLIAEGRWVEAVGILGNTPRDLPFIERLFLASPDGKLMADVPELPDVRGADFSHRDWYQGVRRDWQPYVSPAYQRTAIPRINVFAVATPIRGDDGGVLGILVLQMRLESYFDWIRSVEIGAPASVYVVDSKGRLAFHSAARHRDAIEDFSSLPAVQRMRRGEQGIEIAHDSMEREETVSAFSPVQKFGWGVVVQQPARVAFLTRDQQMRRLFFAYGLVLVFFASAVLLGLQFMAQRRRALDDRRLRGELERRVAERTAQLEAANKELESFSYSVSHDLRSPLRAIDGFSRILDEDYGAQLDGEGRRLIKVVRDSAGSMARLIDDLLEFSRLGRKPIASSEIDMGTLAHEVYQELLAANSGGGRFVFRLSTLPRGCGDPALVRQVWRNLLSNAVKFSGMRDDPVIEVGGRVEDGENIYSVRDNGAGFDMAYYHKLFGVFQRLHTQEEFRGTGVGLAIVQRVITRHGGRVWAESRPGEGAVFYFTLPAGQQAPALRGSRDGG